MEQSGIRGIGHAPDCAAARLHPDYPFPVDRASRVVYRTKCFAPQMAAKRDPVRDSHAQFA
jgi:hypothetical protein